MNTTESTLDREAIPSAAIAPPLPAVTPKAPWRPNDVGLIAFFFGPIAGALILASSLRRMGHRGSARKFVPLALVIAAVECAILAVWIPLALNAFAGLGAEFAFLFIFPVFLKKQFSEWQSTHAGTVPSNGWNAIGWGLLGAFAFVAIYILAFVGVAAVVIIRNSSKTWSSR